MDLELEDKVAVAGGASTRLGRACAEVLAEEGLARRAVGRIGEPREMAYLVAFLASGPVRSVL